MNFISSASIAVVFLLLSFSTLASPAPSLKTNIVGGEFRVISYNTGLARALGNDFVPCVVERMVAQNKNVTVRSQTPTIYIFQELNYNKAYEKLERWAQSNNYYVSRNNSLFSGLVTVSPFRIEKEIFRKYSCNKPLLQRGVLTVEVDANGKKMQITNTHIYDSEGDEPNGCQQTQLRELADHVNQTSDLPSVFGGDINVGPDIKIIKQEYDPIEILWRPFVALLGSSWKRAETEKLGVTWDIEKNILARGGRIPEDEVDGPQLNSTLDHVYVNGELDILSYDIVYDEPVTVPSCKDYESTPGKVHMSDHYGVSAKVSFSR